MCAIYSFLIDIYRRYLNEKWSKIYDQLSKVFSKQSISYLFYLLSNSSFYPGAYPKKFRRWVSILYFVCTESFCNFSQSALTIWWNFPLRVSHLKLPWICHCFLLPYSIYFDFQLNNVGKQLVQLEKVWLFSIQSPTKKVDVCILLFLNNCIIDNFIEFYTVLLIIIQCLLIHGQPFICCGFWKAFLSVLLLLYETWIMIKGVKGFAFAI